MHLHTWSQLIYFSHVCSRFLSRHRLIVSSVHYQAIIQSILISGRLGPNVQNASCFGLRLKHLKSEEHHWLHPDLTVGEVEQRYEKLHLEAEWRWEAILNTCTTLICIYQMVCTYFTVSLYELSICCFFCHYVLCFRYDLRIRYIPANYLEKFKDDRTSLLYLYHQVSMM